MTTRSSSRSVKKLNAAKEELCPKCSGYGWVIGEDGAARRCDCGISGRSRSARLFEAANIPLRFRGKSFANYHAERGDRERAAVLDFAKRYAAGFSEGEDVGLILRGIPGSGKTHIAVAILHAVMERGFSGSYANFTDLLSRLRDSYNAGAREVEGELLRQVDDVDLLVLDDVGAESTSDWVRDRLYLIINRRYENARATIVTTNCDEAELEARIGPRTASRLYEMCSGDFPTFPRQDYRKANMK